MRSELEHARTLDAKGSSMRCNARAERRVLKNHAFGCTRATGRVDDPSSVICRNSGTSGARSGGEGLEESFVDFDELLRAEILEAIELSVVNEDDGGFCVGEDSLETREWLVCAEGKNDSAGL